MKTSLTVLFIIFTSFLNAQNDSIKINTKNIIYKNINGYDLIEYFFNVADTLRIPFKKYYIEGKNGINKGFLNLTMSDIDVQDGLILTEIPFSQNVTKSHVFLDSKELSGVKIGIFKDALAVNWNNGELVNSVNFKNLTLRFDFESIGVTLNNNSYITRSL